MWSGVQLPPLCYQLLCWASPYKTLPPTFKWAPSLVDGGIGPLGLVDLMDQIPSYQKKKNYRWLTVDIE